MLILPPVFQGDLDEYIRSYYDLICLHILENNL
jgi:hypothetical protein